MRCLPDDGEEEPAGLQPDEGIVAELHRSASGLSSVGRLEERIMNLSFGSQYEAFRREVRAFLDSHKEGAPPALGAPEGGPDVRRWQKTLIEHGYAARTIPDGLRWVRRCARSRGDHHHSGGVSALPVSHRA